MPIQSGDLNRVEVLSRIGTGYVPEQQTDQINDLSSHVHPVETREDEEGGLKKCRGLREVMRWMSDAHAFFEDQVRPFIGLEGEEDQTAQNGETEELAQLRLIAMPNRR